MIVIRVNSQEFEEELKKLNQVHAFNSPQFAMLNNLWVDEIHFLLFKTNRTLLALTLGERDGKLLSPFSAPYGGFSYLKDSISISSLKKALSLLFEYAMLCNCKHLSLSFPPSLYASMFLDKLTFCCNAISQNRILDINYHMNLLNSTLDRRQDSEYRRNLNKGKKNELTLHKCENLEEKQLCYDIIDENYTKIGYPVRIGFDPLLKISKIIDIDFFLLRNSKESYAGAIVYWITNDIVQVILWGNYSIKRGEGCMHTLSALLREYYQQRNVRILDLGPSSDNGVPNLGLCKFKESIGCDVTLKFSYSFEL